MQGVNLARHPNCVHARCVQVLELLWELAHLPTLPTSLVQQALEEHLGILSDAYAVKETVKRSYIIKCIEDIKKVGEELPCTLCCSPMFIWSLRIHFYCVFSSFFLFLFLLWL